MIVLRVQVLLKLHALTRESYFKITIFLFQILFMSSIVQARNTIVNLDTERKFTVKFILKTQSDMSVDVCIFYSILWEWRFAFEYSLFRKHFFSKFNDCKCWFIGLHKVDFKAMIPKLWLKYPMGEGEMSEVDFK
jgi:hypothetical protein